MVRSETYEREPLDLPPDEAWFPPERDEPLSELLCLLREPLSASDCLLPDDPRELSEESLC